MVTYSKKLSKSGNGLVVRVPKEIADHLKLTDEDLVEVTLRVVQRKEGRQTE